jgi:hypothetical protein
MSWVTVVWSILIGACAFLLVGVAARTIGLAVRELALMHAMSPEQYGVVQRCLGPPIFVIVVREIREATSKLLFFGSGTHTKQRT